MPEEVSGEALKALEGLSDVHKRLKEEIGKVIVGQERVIDLVLISLLCRGHSLLIGVPGLAKTLLVKTLAQMLDLRFSRVQFTPDLMPADITGTDIIQEDPETHTRELKFISGPLFANVVLADEINRAPPKTQAALLEAMQEYHVTVGGRTYDLEEPFLVLATQNPIEQEGTYPLPEAQLDRFMFDINVDYPGENEETEIILKTTAGPAPEVERLVSQDELLAAQKAVRKVPVSEETAQFAARIARLSRPRDGAPETVERYVRWGAGPRAGQYMILAAKARSALAGRLFVTREDVLSTAGPVLRHRMVLNFRAEAENVGTERITANILQEASRA